MSSLGHWVLTLIELELAVHGFLLQVTLGRLSLYNGFLVRWVLASEPGLEFFVLVADEFQRFSHHIGRRAIKKLCILCELRSCFVVEPKLDNRGFWLLRRRLQDRNWHLLLSVFDFLSTLHSVCLHFCMHAGKTWSPFLAD